MLFVNRFFMYGLDRFILANLYISKISSLRQGGFFVFCSIIKLI